MDPELLLRRLSESAVHALDAQGGAGRLVANGNLRTMHVAGARRGAAEISIQLVARGQRIGILRLGPRRSGQVHDALDFGALVQIAAVIARAIARTQSASRPPAPNLGSHSLRGARQGKSGVDAGKRIEEGRPNRAALCHYSKSSTRLIGSAAAPTIPGPV